MLDQPLILLTALRTLLSDWDTPSPPARATGREASAGRRRGTEGEDAAVAPTSQ